MVRFLEFPGLFRVSNLTAVEIQISRCVQISRNQEFPGMCLICNADFVPVTPARTPWFHRPALNMTQVLRKCTPQFPVLQYFNPNSDQLKCKLISYTIRHGRESTSPPSCEHAQVYKKFSLREEEM